VLQQIKGLIRDQLGLSPSLMFIVAGCVVHLALNAVLRKPLTSATGLLAPLALGLALESYEIWVQYRNVGLFAPGNDPLFAILWRHGFDIVKILAAPLLLVAAGTLSTR